MSNYTHVAWLLPLACLCAGKCDGAPLQDGRLSGVVHDVRITQPGSKPLPAATNKAVRDGLIQTGPASRVEITFPDQTVIRLGDNTAVQVDSKSRTFDLDRGAVLTQVPTGVGSTIIKVHAITATATGNALVIECLPEAYTKFIVLDGTTRLCLRAGEWNRDCVLLRAGQMLIAGPKAKGLPESVDVDLTRLNQTCQFIAEFSKLPGQDRLNKAAAAQRSQKTNGAFADTNLVIFGRGTLVSQKGKNGLPAAKSVSASPTPSPKPNSASP
jgi:hypothetical protein